MAPNAASGRLSPGGPEISLPLPVVLIGRAALRALSERAQGRVVAVFERSFYLENCCGELVCIAGRDVGAGPVNALVAAPSAIPPWTRILRVGKPYIRDECAIRLPGGLALSLHGARLWRPAAPPGELRRELLRTHLRGLRLAARRAAPATGLGFLIAGRAPRYRDPLSAACVATALPATQALRAWLRGALALPAGRELPPPPAGAGGLLGLGPGLTPSGDDLICGALLALHAMGRRTVATALARWALPLAREGSPPISTAHLAAAADGEGAAGLHLLLRGLGRDPAWGLPPHLPTLAALGHTSGWDALTGIWLAMNAYVTPWPRDGGWG
jgi:hypothetical protein